MAEHPDEAAEAEAAKAGLREGIERAKALVRKARRKMRRAVEPAAVRADEPGRRD